MKKLSIEERFQYTPNG